MRGNFPANCCLSAPSSVSCALAAMLSGCTKEEFIAGYKEFLFGDPSSSSESSAPSTAPESTDASSESPSHTYDPPNPECDAKIASVESTYDSAVSSVVSEMRSVLREYNQPETVADQAWSYYQSAKSSMISSLGG